MKKSYVSIILIFMMLFTTFVPTQVGAVGNQLSSEEDQDKIFGNDNIIENDQDSSKPEKINKQQLLKDILDRFSVSESYVEQQQEAGYTLNEIYSILFYMETQQLSYEEVLKILFPSPINVAHSETGPVNEEVLQEQEILPSIVAVGVVDSDTDNVSGSGKFFKSSNLEEPIELEEPPVYDSSTINQAPYSIGIENESISTLTGGLSLQYSDMNLPGRNGLSFSLNRIYDTASSQFDDIDYYKSTSTVNAYYVTFDAIKTTKDEVYTLTFDADKHVQEDRGNCSLYYIGGPHPPSYDLLYGIYDDSEVAKAKMDNPSFTKPGCEKTATSSLTKSTNSFPSTMSYSSGGYRGTLTKSGSSYVSSGSFTPADSRTETDSCEHTIVGHYDSTGNWKADAGGDSGDCPPSIPYNIGGYTGTLSRTSTTTNKPCLSPNTPGYKCTKSWTANYSGTVTRPESDTRKWKQEYSGTVSTSTTTSSTMAYGDWDTSGRYPWRYVYELKGSLRMETETVYEPTGEIVTLETQRFATRSAAEEMQQQIESSIGALVNYKDEEYLIANSPSTSVESDPISVDKYYNKTVMSFDERLYPIGKGWSWELPSIESKDGKKYMHMAGGGSYEINGSSLKNYPWEGFTFSTDTSVTVGEEHSQYKLTSTDGLTKQYFTSDGRVIQISDAYDNTIQFFYDHHAVYDRKLLSQVQDAIGNTIDITYTETEVTLTKGEEKVTYHKRMEEGKELLDSVVDAENRRTEYKYSIGTATSNLIASKSSRAISNDYALLTEIHHPTGAVTSYEYEPSPVKRYIGSSSINYVYRIASREDQIWYDNGTQDLYNRQYFNYNGTDYGQSYSSDFTFSTTINDLIETKYTYSKDYVSSSVGSKYYLDQVQSTAEGSEKTTAYEYSKKVGSNTYPVEVATSTTRTNNQTSDQLITSTTYDDYGNVTHTTAETGATTTYTYDRNHLLETVLQQVDQTRSIYKNYARNEQGSITQIEVRENGPTGKLLQKINYSNFDPYGNIRTVTVQNTDSTTESAIEYSSVYQSAFPTMQNVQVTDVDGVNSTITTTAEYDILTGRLTSWKDGRQNTVGDPNEGKETGYQYDHLGRIEKVVYPDATTFTVAYDDLNNTTTSTNAEANQTQTIFNSLGWKVEEGWFDEVGYKKKADYHYDLYGRLDYRIDESLNTTQYTYDNWGRQTGITHGNDAITTIQYNDAQRTVTTTDPEQNGVIESYDLYGNVQQIEEKNFITGVTTKVASYEHEPISRQTLKQMDGKDNSTQFTYDVTGQLQSVTNDLLETTTYEYDMMGNLTKLIYPDGNFIEKKYDEKGRLIQTIDAMNQTEKMYYDSNSNVIRNIDRNGVNFHYEYTSLNQLEKQISPDETISYLYDQAGRRISMTDITGNTFYDYNDYTGELDAVTYPDGLNIVYEYENGLLKSMTDPFGLTTYYTYNSLNGLATIGTNNPDLGSDLEVDVEYSYYDNGQLQNTHLNNVPGIDSEYIYKGTQLDTLTHQVGTNETNRFKYGYDNNKNIVTRTENDVTELFTYDDLNRIETSAEFDEVYSYDNRGNRLTMQSTQFPSKRPKELGYDDRDRLTDVTIEGKRVEYKYNGDGYLVERSEQGETTRYYYDGEVIIAEATIVNGTPRLKAHYIRGNQLEIIEYADASRAYVLTNGHGDVVELRDENGNVLNAYTYDIWGNPIIEQEQIHNPFRYAGELWDDATQLQYLRARWYDPSIGRFINEDTYEGEINNPLSLNLYTYVKNNPLRYSDPSGNKEEEAGNIHVRNDIYVEDPWVTLYINKVATYRGKGSRKGKQELVKIIAKEFVDASNLTGQIWRFDPFTRGEIFEEVLAQTEYEFDDWYNIGQEQNGFFPVLDFVNSRKAVSVKSIDPRSYKDDLATYKALDYINALTERKIYIGGDLVENEDRILHIVIPKGTKDYFDHVRINKASKGIEIIWEEF
ncbi:RHS repeat-associated core domain-containing protein [Chengkuizengella sediminis]|uniref:RHS repeat-associated core domain-containing protein n=1 Tax=Chengkuizengella sediminis TaxID=1885917 RepID=UPI00138962F0|nr:RHS repeat-associated core domain-containing protein [Chengkuizengella sediminis]NDI33804.1 type IV secretion protein Rhs [Chengkuizengella sediminis]